MGTIVLVCANAPTPTAGDLVIQGRLEAVGHTVVRTSDEEAEYSGTYDGVFISDSSSGGTVGSKYSTVAKPGITCENVTWRLGSYLSGINGTQWTIENVPGNGGLTGTQTVYTAVQSQQAVDTDASNFPSGAIVVARLTGDPDHGTYVQYPAGINLTSGTAPEKRVFLRIADTVMDELSPEGTVMLDAAINWAFASSLLTPPTVSAGPDQPTWPIGYMYQVTGVITDNGDATVAYEGGWEIVSGPSNVGPVGPTYTIQFTPNIVGSWVFKFWVDTDAGYAEDTFTLTSTEDTPPQEVPNADIVTSWASFVNSDAQIHDITLTGSPIQAGDQILVIQSAEESRTTAPTTSSSGWTMVGSMANGTTTNVRQTVFYCENSIAGGSPLSINMQTGFPQRASYIIYHLRAAASPIFIAQANGGNDTQADFTPLSGLPSENYLHILAVSVDFNSAITLTLDDGVEPGQGGYLENFYSGTGNRAIPAELGTAATLCADGLRQGSTGTAPPALTFATAGSEQWVSANIYIGPGEYVDPGPDPDPDPPIEGAPGEYYDLSQWHLTTPEDSGDGDAEQINQPALETYETENFYLDSEGKMVFIADVDGFTTSGASGATRMELRQRTPSYQNIAFNPYTASQRITITTQADATSITGGSNPRQELIIWQIHGASGSPPLLVSAEYNNDRIRVFKDGPSINPTTIQGISPDTLITIRCIVDDGEVRLWVRRGTVDDLPAESTTADFEFPASAFEDDVDWYFKVGSYNKTQISSNSNGRGIAKVSYFELNGVVLGQAGNGGPPPVGDEAFLHTMFMLGAA